MGSAHTVVNAATRAGSPPERLETVFVAGRVDAGQLQAAQSDVKQLASNLRDFQAVVSRERPVWVAPQIDAAVEELDLRLGPAFERSDDADAIANALPSLLGIEGPRRYLVLFGNPAEARELGGFTGATAVLELDAGSFSLETSGRRAGPRTSTCLLYTSPSPRDQRGSRMPSSA